MLMRSLAALLILQCWLLLAYADGIQYMNIDSFASVGTVNFKGSSLRVFEVDGAQVAEPRVSFAETCDSLRYNHLFRKYQLTLPTQIDTNTLEPPTDSSKKVGQLIITGLQIKADEALTRKDAQITIVARLTKPGEAQLIFLCDTFLRCQELKDDIHSNPRELLRTVKFVPVGRIGSNPVKFGAIQSATLPKFNCAPGRWVVFQRRVDGSLSFAQNWDTYVKGFGNPESNYWMGLDRLFAMTVTSSMNGYTTTSRCQLRVETEDFTGRSYWGEYKMFQILGPAQNYRLRLGLEVSGSQLSHFVPSHNEMQFSTFDRDHDTRGSDSCSQLLGFGGWWYSACHSVNLNGAYATDKSITDNPTYCSAIVTGKHLPMKHTLMKFRCD